MIAADTLTVNDTDADDLEVSIQSVSNAVNGTVALSASGNVEFTPDAVYRTSYV